MNHTVFAGCSYTVGDGFEARENDSLLWVNQLHDKFFPNTIKTNLGISGASNTRIFHGILKALLSSPVSYAFVQWTSAPRYEVELGLETYDTQQLFIPSTPCRDHILHDIKYTKKYLETIRDRWVTLPHPWSEILKIVDYTNTIIQLAKLTNTKVFFINGLCPWDKNFFVRKIDVLPDQYTKYTQKLIKVNTRDDNEVLELYNKIHSNFDDIGGINEHLWLNLYESMNRNMIDLNSDNQHPGYKSNIKYYQMFSARLNSVL